MRDDVINILFWVIVAVFIMSYLGGRFHEWTDDDYSRWRKIKMECEASLPRDQNCVLYAIPEQKEDEK